jgi:hypothetical protein
MPRGGKAAKRKGDRAENEVKRLLGGERTFWQPENSTDEKRGDLWSVPGLGKGEVKIRADGFKQIYGWLADNDFLAIRADKRFWLICMRLEDVKKLLKVTP